MPLYEYGCPSCGLVTDVRHGFDEKPEVACEKCGTRLVRRFSAAPIVFKGSGFYVTDSRSKSSSSGSSSSAAASSGDGEKSEAKKTEPAASSSGDGEKKTGEKKSDTAAA